MQVLDITLFFGYGVKEKEEIHNEASGLRILQRFLPVPFNDKIQFLVLREIIEDDTHLTVRSAAARRRLGWMALGYNVSLAPARALVGVAEFLDMRRKTAFNERVEECAAVQLEVKGTFILSYLETRVAGWIKSIVHFRKTGSHVIGQKIFGCSLFILLAPFGKKAGPGVISLHVLRNNEEGNKKPGKIHIRSLPHITGGVRSEPLYDGWHFRFEAARNRHIQEAGTLVRSILEIMLHSTWSDEEGIFGGIDPPVAQQKAHGSFEDIKNIVFVMRMRTRAMGVRLQPPF